MFLERLILKSFVAQPYVRCDVIGNVEPPSAKDFYFCPTLYNPVCELDSLSFISFVAFQIEMFWQDPEQRYHFMLRLQVGSFLVKESPHV